VVADLASGVLTTLRQYRIFGQVARFIVVGLLCMGLNVACFAVLVDGLGWNYLAVTVLAYVCVSAVGFGLNRLWTFQATDGAVPVQAARFVFIQSLSLLLNMALMWVLVGQCGIGSPAASVVASILFAMGNFLAQRGWAFRRR